MSSSTGSEAEVISNKKLAMIFKLLGKGELNIIPVMDHSIGVRYPYVEKSLNLKPEEVSELLESLIKERILTKNLYDKVFACPRCGSVNLSPKGLCPSCGSFDIEKRRLLEHLKCGTKFVVNKLFEGIRPVCPKDESKLENREYRVLASWFECGVCRRKFETPEVGMHCLGCTLDFKAREAEFQEVYFYALTDEMTAYAKKLGTLRTIAESLISVGYEAHLVEEVKGVSGGKHSFDLVAYKSKGEKQIRIVIDLPEESKGEEDTGTIIGMFAKILDVKPDKAILIAIPSLSNIGKNLAKQYNIEVVEGKDVQEAAASLIQKLS